MEAVKKAKGKYILKKNIFDIVLCKSQRPLTLAQYYRCTLEVYNYWFAKYNLSATLYLIHKGTKTTIGLMLTRYYSGGEIFSGQQ